MLNKDFIQQENIKVILAIHLNSTLGEHSYNVNCLAQLKPEKNRGE